MAGLPLPKRRHPSADSLKQPVLADLLGEAGDPEHRLEEAPGPRDREDDSLLFQFLPEFQQPDVLPSRFPNLDSALKRNQVGLGSAPLTAARTQSLK